MTPDRRPPIVDVWLQMTRTQRALERRFSAPIAVHGLTLAQVDVLYTLIESGPLVQRDLAARLCVTKGNVAQVVDRLERAGLVVRAGVEGDRRARLLRPTRRGTQLLEAVRPAFQAAVERAFRSIGTARLRALERELALLENEADSESSPAD